MNLLVYLLPERLREVAISGERNEFDLNEFFRANGTGGGAVFEHTDQVQGWLDWLRGQDVDAAVEVLAAGTAKPFPYADTNVLPYMNHTVWFLPSVASVFAMKNLLAAAAERGASGASSASARLLETRPVWVLPLYPPFAMPSAAATTPRRSRSPAASSSPASRCRNGRPF